MQQLPLIVVEPRIPEQHLWMTQYSGTFVCEVIGPDLPKSEEWYFCSVIDVDEVYHTKADKSSSHTDIISRERARHMIMWRAVYILAGRGIITDNEAGLAFARLNACQPF